MVGVVGVIVANPWVVSPLLHMSTGLILTPVDYMETKMMTRFSSS